MNIGLLYSEKNLSGWLGLAMVATIFFSSCSNFRNRQSSENTEVMEKIYNKGEYGFDRELLFSQLNPVELIDGNARVLIAPEYQGRVMTSTSNAEKGFSYGWINHYLIRKGEVQKHINAYGGEERLWFGPEGGQFSIFFEPEAPFDLEHWQTPACIDTEAFQIISQDETSVSFSKNLELKNYSGTNFYVEVKRRVSLINRWKISDILGVELPEEVRSVAYCSENVIMNKGNEEWTKQSGALSIWMLGMLNPSPDVTVIIPFRNDTDGKIVNSDYFGVVPNNRLVVGESAVFFKADGKYRSKIGIPPGRAMSRIGSYDAKNNILTILECTLDNEAKEYVNSAWEIQENPFGGDVINSYNDGPLENGSQMGPFYELETSSKAAFLKPDEELLHVQNTFHFEGTEENLNFLSKELLRVSLDEISSKF